MSEFSLTYGSRMLKGIHKADKDGQYAVAAALFQMAKAINDLRLDTTLSPRHHLSPRRYQRAHYENAWKVFLNYPVL